MSELKEDAVILEDRIGFECDMGKYVDLKNPVHAKDTFYAFDCWHDDYGKTLSFEMMHYIYEAMKQSQAESPDIKHYMIGFCVKKFKALAAENEE